MFRAAFGNVCTQDTPYRSVLCAHYRGRVSSMWGDSNQAWSQTNRHRAQDLSAT